MRNILKKILLFYFQVTGYLILRIKKPLIIAITGSAAKTTTKEMIAFILEKYATYFPENLIKRLHELGFKTHRRILVFKNFESLNNEFGIPLTLFLGSFRPGNNIFNWLKVIFLSWLAFIRRYPDILVLELGVERPNDMAYFMKFIKPHIGIFTLLSEFPAHLQFFKKKEDVAKEKGLLIEHTQILALLNFDEPLIKNLASKTKAKVWSFGQSFDVDCQILQHGHYRIFNKLFQITIEPYSNFGIFFDLPILLSLSLLEFLKAPSEVIQFFSEFQPLVGRLRILKNQINGQQVLFFDDTYNASPASYFHLFNIAQNIHGQKLAILADILECDPEAPILHQLLGEKMNQVFDYVILIGPRMKLFAQPQLTIPYEVFEKADFNLIGQRVKDLILNKNFNFIFVKGARGFHLEKILNFFGFENQTVKCFCNYRPGFHNLEFKV